MAHLWRGVIEEYRDRLPVSDETPGRHACERAARRSSRAQVCSGLTGCSVQLKVEGSNPTGSFKDRGMTVADLKALEEGAKAVVCASTGNTSASAAAYARRAGHDCRVWSPTARSPGQSSRRRWCTAAGSWQVRRRRSTTASELARALAERLPGGAGQLASTRPGSGSEDRCVRDRRRPRRCARRPRAAGRQRREYLGVLEGYQEYAADGPATRCPRMWGFQAAGAAPIVRGEPVAEPTTVASAIRIGNPALVGPRRRRARRFRAG